MGRRARLLAITLFGAALHVSVQAAAPPPPVPTSPTTEAPSTDEPPSTAETDIVVTGEKPMSTKEFDEAARTFVNNLGRRGPMIRQISRWGETICPIVSGLSKDFNQFVAIRIREVATHVGAPDGPCSEVANTLVIFTTRPDQVMADVRDNHRGWLGYHFAGERKSLAAFQPPMKSWYVTKTLIPGSYEAIDHAYGSSPPTGTGSHIRPRYQSRFAFALVVVDSSLLEGQAIDAVADKIAMLVLSAPTPRQGCSALPSVLDFLEPDCSSNRAVEGLTSYDEAFLKGLYAFDRNERTSLMREGLRASVAGAANRPGE